MGLIGNLPAIEAGSIEIFYFTTQDALPRFVYCAFDAQIS
jgi:hypothetical protein